MLRLGRIACYATREVIEGDGEGAGATMANDPTTGRDNEDGLEQLTRGRLGRQARLRRAGALVALVATVAIGLVWRSGGWDALTGSAPTPTAIPGVDAPLLVTSNVTFGTFTVDGRRVAGPPAIIHLQQGQHVLRLAATPFAPTTCTFTWPYFASLSSSSDACGFGVATADSVVVRGRKYSITYRMQIVVRGTQLATADCTRLRATLADALTAARPSTPVPAGDYVATGAYQGDLAVAARATAPAVARVSAALVPPSTRSPRSQGANIASQSPCADVQDDGQGWDPVLYGDRIPAEQRWLVSVLVQFALAFQSPGADGSDRQGENGGQIGRTREYATTVLLDVVLGTDGGWSLDPGVAGGQGFPLPVVRLDEQLARASCLDAAEPELNEAVHRIHPDTRVVELTVPESLDALRGCQMVVDSTGGSTATPRVPASRPTFLWRFGVLLAVNAPARAMIPGVPQAPTSDLADMPAT